MKTPLMAGLFVGAVACVMAISTAQAQTSPKMKMTTEIPAGIAIPDTVETRLGTLKFFDGFPDDATVEKLYDNLDFQRAVQAYLLGLAPVNQLANRKGIAELGPTIQRCRSLRTAWTQSRCSSRRTTTLRTRGSGSTARGAAGAGGTAEGARADR